MKALQPRLTFSDSNGWDISWTNSADQSRYKRTSTIDRRFKCMSSGHKPIAIQDEDDKVHEVLGTIRTKLKNSLTIELEKQNPNILHDKANLSLKL